MLRFEKSKSLIGGIIFALVFAGLFFIAMRCRDMTYITVHGTKYSTGIGIS